MTDTTPKRLFVFDFDWTLIECDSDNWVFQHLNQELYQVQLMSVGKVQWTDLQQRLLGSLFDSGVSRKDIENTLRRIPFEPAMIEALTTMKDHGAELYILSDANTIYIETVLKAHRIDHLFTRIITNPATFDERGRLNVSRFHGLDEIPHDCRLPCEPNICKGKEIQKLIDSREWDQVVYMGDSSNDFCPSTRLQRSDVVLAREGLLLQSLIEQSTEMIKAKVVYWRDAQDVLMVTRNMYQLSTVTVPVPITDSVVSSASSSTASFSTIASTAIMDISSPKSVTHLSTIESQDSKSIARAVKA
ncbi:putative phosphatase phospho1 [Podila epigama]|nr:putative phosphatase phospho1 [Podila epigama]